MYSHVYVYTAGAIQARSQDFEVEGASHRHRQTARAPPA